MVISLDFNKIDLLARNVRSGRKNINNFLLLLIVFVLQHSTIKDTYKPYYPYIICYVILT